jgi:hypothetical protein
MPFVMETEQSVLNGLNELVDSEEFDLTDVEICSGCGLEYPPGVIGPEGWCPNCIS